MPFICPTTGEISSSGCKPRGCSENKMWTTRVFIKLQIFSTFYCRPSVWVLKSWVFVWFARFQDLVGKLKDAAKSVEKASQMWRVCPLPAPSCFFFFFFLRHFCTVLRHTEVIIVPDAVLHSSLCLNKTVKPSARCVLNISTEMIRSDKSVLRVRSWACRCIFPARVRQIIAFWRLGCPLKHLDIFIYIYFCLGSSLLCCGSDSTNILDASTFCGAGARIKTPIHQVEVAFFFSLPPSLSVLSLFFPPHLHLSAHFPPFFSLLQMSGQRVTKVRHQSHLSPGRIPKKPSAQSLSLCLCLSGLRWRIFLDEDGYF